MTTRPPPPLSTDSPDELAEHVTHHAPEWLLYLRNLNAVVSMQEEEIATLRTTVIERDGVVQWQQKQLKEAQEDLIKARVAEQQALKLAQPNVPIYFHGVATPNTSGPAEPAVGDVAAPSAAPDNRSSASARLSARLPDPDKFDGDRDDLRRFTQQIYGKLTANTDRFPTAEARLTYVAGRLQGKAYKLVLPKTVYGVPQFIDYPDLLAYLEKAFGDPNRVQNAQNKLYNLKQRGNDFSVFFSEFQRLALEGEIAEQALLPLLFQGISRELQDMVLHSPAPSKEFHDYARHLQNLDNCYRKHQQQVRRSRNADRNLRYTSTLSYPTA